MEKDDEVILQFKKSEEGISVIANSGITIDILIGIAETIQLITEETKEKKENILSDINKILEVLENKEEK